MRTDPEVTSIFRISSSLQGGVKAPLTEYLAACSAVPITIIERDSLGTMLGTLHEKVSGLLIGEL